MKSITYFYVLYLVFLYTLISGDRLHAQGSRSKSLTINTNRISISQGLSDSRITSIMQDSYGFLWISTFNGLDRYDGYDFKVYKHETGDNNSIGDNRVFKITEDKDHNLWIAQWNGVSRFNRYTGTFKNYNLNMFARDFTPNLPKVIYIYCDSKNNIWTGNVSNQVTTGEILKYNRKTDQFIAIDFDSTNPGSNNNYGYNVMDGICEYKGKIWALSWIHGLCYYDAKKNLMEAQNFVSDDNSVKYTNLKVPGYYLYPDKNGYLWILTGGGIFKYNYTDNSFSVISKFKTVYRGNDFFTATADNEGNLWTACGPEGLLKFKGFSDNFETINYGENIMKNGQNGIQALAVDKSGVMWIGTWGQGIFKYDPTGEPFVSYKYNSQNQNSLSGNQISALYQSKVNSNLIYVGTHGSGFDKFYPLQNKFERINFKLKKDNYGGSVNTFLENEDGSLYLGTAGAGLYKYKTNGSIELVAQRDSSSSQSLFSNYISVLARDANGQIWIGDNGLNIYNPITKKMTRIQNHLERQYPNELMNLIRSKENSPAVVQSILKVGNSQNLTKDFSIKEPGKYLCVSVGEGGLVFGSQNNSDYGWLENQKGDTIWTAQSAFKTYYLGGAIKDVISADIVNLVQGSYKLRYVSDDSHSYGHWNATPPPDSALWGIQVIKLNDKEIQTAESVFRKVNSQPLTSGWIISDIHISPNGLAWIGTVRNGLTRYNPVTQETKYYKSDPKNPNSLSSNTISNIYEDKNGIFWIATREGLDRFDPVKEKFTVYTENDGLPTNNLTSVLEDNSGNIWISSENGISRMIISKSSGKVSFVNYNTRDGLSSTSFSNPQAAIKASSGKLYFGSNQGLNEFSPAKFNNIPPIVQITDIKLSNKSIAKMGENDPLKVPVMNAKKITLSSSQNNISFEFSALHFSQPEKNEYSHILKGYDKEWNHDDRRFASYTNLDPGKYVFKVRASNNDGIWNEKGASIEVFILPPWWKTIWAYAGYVLLLAGLVFSVDRFQRKRLLTKERERQRVNEIELRAKAAEAESRALEIENQRKTKELEEARQLQLSLLPKQLPSLPHLDIAVYMKTATEVGGDYYDFHLAIDGTLTVVLGDATGHGMKAGTMVTAAKSLFNSYASNPDIIFTFHEMSRCIKQMHFHMLSMCLAMLKISGDKIKMSSAGMPPILIYRKNDRTIEEHVIKGMPLGAIDKFPYDLKETKLKTGDTLLLFSDGLPELHNSNEEMFGYKRVRNVFEDVAEKGPEEIIEHLKTQGSKWVDDKEPEDDVTFVVIKIK